MPTLSRQKILLYGVAGQRGNFEGRKIYRVETGFCHDPSFKGGL